MRKSRSAAAPDFEQLPAVLKGELVMMLAAAVILFAPREADDAVHAFLWQLKILRFRQCLMRASR
jgi:hypothetical protein